MFQFLIYVNSDYIQPYVSLKISLLHKTNNNKKNRTICLLKICPWNIQFMHSVFSRGSFCLNCCISVAWHWGNQAVALLRCWGTRAAPLVCVVGADVSHLPPDRSTNIPCRIQVKTVWWSIRHRDSIIIRSDIDAFGSADRSQVLLKILIRILIKLISRTVITNFVGW